MVGPVGMIGPSGSAVRIIQIEISFKSLSAVILPPTDMCTSLYRVREGRRAFMERL